MASILVDSLKRLYAAGKVTREQIEERVARGIISEKESQYIIGEEDVTKD